MDYEPGFPDSLADGWLSARCVRAYDYKAIGRKRRVWARDGKELFYQSGAKLMSVRATPQELGAKPPSVLFEGGFIPEDPTSQRSYDVAPNGNFLMIEPNESATPVSLVLVKNWVEEVKRLVPTK